MLDTGLKNVVQLSENVFVDMHGITHEKLEAVFYLGCYFLKRHDVANQTLKAIDDPYERKDIVVRAWLIAYCRLGAKVVKKVTTRKAKRIFSIHPNVKGDFLETGEKRLWLSVDDKEIKKRLSNDTVAVVLPMLDSYAFIKRSELPKFKKFTAYDLAELQNKLMTQSAPALA